ncbi:MAG: NADH-dependent oxidoreductase, partial [Kiritimatiellia bacterium]
MRGLLIEAEYFEDLGGWTLDTTAIGSMGTPYLMAHGLGIPVADARTTLQFPSQGAWRVWVRTLDWVARWDAPGAPGKFQVLINGRPCPTIFGTKGVVWHWQDGGVVEIACPNVTIALRDLTGFNGRCDALYFTRELDAGPPPNNHSVLAGWRWEALGAL